MPFLALPPASVFFLPLSFPRFFSCFRPSFSTHCRQGRQASTTDRISPVSVLAATSTLETGRAGWTPVLSRVLINLSSCLVDILGNDGPNLDWNARSEGIIPFDTHLLPALGPCATSDQTHRRGPPPDLTARRILLTKRSLLDLAFALFSSANRVTIQLPFRHI